MLAHDCPAQRGTCHLVKLSCTRVRVLHCPRMPVGRKMGPLPTRIYRKIVLITHVLWTVSELYYHASASPVKEATRTGGPGHFV